MPHALLEYIVDGDPTLDSSDTIVLLHGFPDNPALWKQTSEHLQKSGYRVVRIALPGFETQSTPPIQPAVIHTFDQTIERLHATLLHTNAHGGTLLGHDWGAIFIYKLITLYPNAAKRIICLEIGGAPKSLILTVIVLLYQGLLTLGHALGPGLGDALVRMVCILFRRPSYENQLNPTSEHAWLYWRAWREGSCHGPWIFNHRNEIARWRPPGKTPFLFLYGNTGLKALRFHSPQWQDSVTKTSPPSRATGIPGRHWFMLETPDAFYEELDSFLEESTQ